MFGEAPLVACGAFAALEDELTESGSGVQGQRPVREVRNFQHLLVRNSGIHEPGREMNHKPEPCEARSSFQAPGDVGRESDSLPGDSVDHLSGSQFEGAVEGLALADVAEVGVFGQVECFGAGFQGADFVVEVKVDRRRADLVGRKWFHDDPSCVDFG